jgi:hypothetical protein
MKARDIEEEREIPAEMQRKAMTYHAWAKCETRNRNEGREIYLINI